MKYIVIIFLLAFNNAPAQNLVPYQVQDLKNWDMAALYGYKSLDFKIIIEPKNEAPNLFVNGYATFQKNKKLGLIDTLGNIIVEPIFEKLSDVIGDYVYVKEFNEFDSYILNVKTNKKFKYKTTNINQRIELSDMPGIFVLYSDNATYKDAYGLMSSDGTTILKPQYSFLAGIDIDLFAVTDSLGKTGIFNTNGSWIIRPTYKNVGMFNDGLASFENNHKYGYIDQNGKIIIPAIYKKAIGYFEHGYATMTNGAENIFLNKNGKICFDGLDIKEILDSRDNLLTVRANNDSLFLMDKNNIGLNQRAANEIAIIDSTGFLYRIGTNLFFQSADTVIKMPGTNFTKISALNTGYYFIESKTDSNTVLKTATNKYLESVAQVEMEGAHFGWSRSMGIIAKYIWDNEKLEENFVTYLDKTGKQYSDFKE